MIRTLLALIVIIGSILAIIFIAVPQYQGTQELRVQVDELEDALQKAAELRAAREQLLAKRNALDPVDLQKLEELLPSHVDNVKLVSIDINNLAERQGLLLRDVSVQEAEETVNDPTQANNPLGTLLINFSTQGSYADFLNFMDDLEHSLRIIDINTIEFTREQQFDRNGNEIIQDFYEFQVTIATYWLRRNLATGQVAPTTAPIN